MNKEQLGYDNDSNANDNSFVDVWQTEIPPTEPPMVPDMDFSQSSSNETVGQQIDQIRQTRRHNVGELASKAVAAGIDLTSDVATTADQTPEGRFVLPR